MRIVSLSPAHTEILYALGLGNRLVGITHSCDYPREAKFKRRVGNWNTHQVDALRLLKPDLILSAHAFPPYLVGYEGPGEIVHFEPRTLGDILSSIRAIGRLCGKKREAEKLAAAMEKKLFLIGKRTPHGNKRLRVYTEEWGYPPTAAGLWLPQLVSIAGGEAILMHPGEQGREVLLSELERADPDVIIIHWHGAGKQNRVSDIAKRPGWKHLRAVRQKRVHTVHDSLLNRPGPRIVEGTKSLHNILRKSRALRSTK